MTLPQGYAPSAGAYALHPVSSAPRTGFTLELSNPANEDVAVWVWEAMRRANLTIKGFAERYGIDSNSVSQWSRGHCRPTASHTREKLSLAGAELGMPPLPKGSLTILPVTPQFPDDLSERFAAIFGPLRA